MSIITRERFSFLAGLSFAKNACGRAFTFTLDVGTQDDATNPTSTSAGLVEKGPVEHGHGEAAAEFGGVAVEVGHQNGPPDTVGNVDRVERVRGWEGWWKCQGKRKDEGRE